MSEQEILPCRICGAGAITRARAVPPGYYVEVYCPHNTCSPTMLTVEEAIAEMMQTGVSATVEITGASYRDRVDRMFSAIIVRCNHLPYTGGQGVYGAENIARQAIEYIDAIDKAIAEREARDV